MSTDLFIIEIVGFSLQKFNMRLQHRYKAMSDVEGFPRFQQNLAVAIFRANKFKKGFGSSYTALTSGRTEERDAHQYGASAIHFYLHPVTCPPPKLQTLKAEISRFVETSENSQHSTRSSPRNISQTFLIG